MSGDIHATPYRGAASKNMVVDHSTILMSKNRKRQLRTRCMDYMTFLTVRVNTSPPCKTYVYDAFDWLLLRTTHHVSEK